ncbi:helix-turn-helix domain-containing protein [Actinokineospora bangkokensis]|uniref:HTH cro/C1-type domain-containing protein n=1 Tax=Actinokineospora bangkokensis TaxID=1193682 RepID=A0A1Q9LBY4_9PSEU|nr:helix-turn-helix transcriptional regulator [Actinokineospora bangkokensis]OLR89541.1 hypothetical protein BJP25_05550 [Actinokineospora bangkokensis]
MAKYAPNTQLAWQRLQRGWSREELVAQIKQSMAACFEAESGLTAETVRRWESGDRWPEPRFRKHLVLLFGLPASELGLLTADELALHPLPLSPSPLASGSPERMVESIVREVVMALFEGKRGRSLLDTSLVSLVRHGVGEPSGLPALRGAASVQLDPRSVDAYSEITAAHRQLYWRSTPQELVASVAAHAQLGQDLLDSRVGRDHTTRRLAAAVAESALLTARLAFFDLQRLPLAAQAFEVAEKAAALAEDHALAAAVAAHQAFVPGFAGDGAQADAHLDAATAHLRYTTSPQLKSWLYCVQAELLARTGRASDSLSRIRLAEDALASDGQDPVWLDFYNSARLDGFAGNALLLGGQHDQAAIRLEAAISGLADAESKQRSVLLFDLAAARAATDAEHALAAVHGACDALNTSWYAAALDRVPALRTALTATPYLAELDERVQALAPAAES